MPISNYYSVQQYAYSGRKILNKVLSCSTLPTRKSFIKLIVKKNNTKYDPPLNNVTNNEDSWFYATFVHQICLINIGLWILTFEYQSWHITILSSYLLIKIVHGSCLIQNTSFNHKIIGKYVLSMKNVLLIIYFN